ncbi:unnamed protein product [Amoebophrya sp. A120]|nr:unnamed protein product [Amoebophrya sp. A120]|eukprot:GSA120T00001312001.1
MSVHRLGLRLGAVRGRAVSGAGTDFQQRDRAGEDAGYNLLNHITKKFSFAFECPLATVSTYWTLATILMFQGSMRRALSMLQMAFIFVRDKGFHECTPWPVQGWDMMMAGRNLLAEVQKLDRPAILWDTPKSFRFANQKVAIVTICSYAPDEAVRVVSLENHGLYAQLHGYDLHMYLSPDEIMPNKKSGMNVKDGVHKPFFWKVNAVKNVFDSENAPDWVMWADCDALYMDPERTIDSVIHMYTGNYSSPIIRKKSNFDETTYNVIDDFLNNPEREKNQEAFSDVSLLLAVDSTGINNGVWMLRNNKWSHDFLERWWHSRILEGPGENHNCSDQSTMQHELLYENSMNLDPAWDMVEGPIWPQQVRVVYQEHMQSFHQATAMTVLSREWQQGDFVRHHPGCHYYKEPCKWLYAQAHEIFMDNLRNMSLKAEQAAALGQ